MTDTATPAPVPSTARRTVRVLLVVLGILQLLFGVLALVVWVFALLKVVGCDVLQRPCADARDEWYWSGAAVVAVVAGGIGLIATGAASRSTRAWTVAGTLAAAALALLAVTGVAFLDAIDGL